jgi:Rieske Fe-S protein
VGHVANAPQPWLALAPERQGRWLVASLEALAVGQALRFTATSVVGFVRRTADGFAALSRDCTHMGWFLDWNASPHTYNCPCPGGRFTEAGGAAPSSPTAYRPLPMLETRVEQGRIWIYIPAITSPPAGLES